MLHFLVRKTSQYLIAMAFLTFAFSAIFITIQAQHEHRESSAKATFKMSKAISQSTNKIINDKVGPKTDKTIYISNFPIKAGRISSRYGMRKDPFTGKRKMHHGIDIAARSGTKIYPVGEGKVIFSGRKSGYGRLIEIEHSDTVVSRYSHLKKSLVKKGQMVKTTDVIAQVGSSGRSTGPHLHLEIAFNGETSNPREFLSREVASNK